MNLLCQCQCALLWGEVKQALNLIIFVTFKSIVNTSDFYLKSLSCLSDFDYGNKMDKPYSLSLHIFRRDLRLEDNTALIEALRLSVKVVPCFIFDSRQIKNNNYKSNAALQFMANSLLDLDAVLRQRQSHLYCFSGIAEEVISQLIEQYAIDAIFLNRDYTPFSRERDNSIEKICLKYKVAYYSYADALLHEPEEVLKADGKPYTVFTPFCNRAKLLTVSAPRANTADNFYQANLAFEDKQDLTSLLKIQCPDLFLKGGRTEALNLLSSIKRLVNYAEIRNFPALNGTSKLSAHNKFGTLSVREFYSAVVQSFGYSAEMLTELYWRDFFTHIAFHYPHVFETSFHRKYSELAWGNNIHYFQRWCEGKTGFPIVDAAMRQLNTTGFMHNRARMITASFLVKDLHIDWRWGEKYFAQHLVDYDPAVNNGNWQWAASTGCDAQPYFRIFNPWLQQAKYDPECHYIKQFVPELIGCSAKEIHQLSKCSAASLKNYPRPIVDHATASTTAKALYKSASQ